MVKCLFVVVAVVNEHVRGVADAAVAVAVAVVVGVHFFLQPLQCHSYEHSRKHQ